MRPSQVVGAAFRRDGASQAVALAVRLTGVACPPLAVPVGSGGRSGFSPTVTLAGAETLGVGLKSDLQVEMG